MDRHLVLGIVFLGLVSVALVSTPREASEDTSTEIQDNAYMIGVLSITKQGDPHYRYLADIAITEINQYCTDSGLDYRFQASYSCSEGQARVTQENTERFHEGGIKLAVGYAWSSCYCAGLNGYGEENGMVIMSTGSTSPLSCCRKVDHGFRLFPYDGLQAEPLASSIIDRGYTNLIVIARSDSWADQIIEKLEPVYTQKGGRIQALVEYPGDTWNESFKLYVGRLFEEHNSTEKPGSTAILAVSFDEIGGMLNEVAEYPELLNVTWFGSDATANLLQLLDEAGETASKVKMLCPFVTVPVSPKFDKMNADFEAEFFTPLTFDLCNAYDSIWLMALSVIEAGTDEAEAITGVLPTVAEGYVGLSGSIGFDEYGDRLQVDYEYWGVFEEEGEYVNKVCGYYHHIEEMIDWYENP